MQNTFRQNQVGSPWLSFSVASGSARQIFRRRSISRAYDFAMRTASHGSDALLQRLRATPPALLAPDLERGGGEREPRATEGEPAEDVGDVVDAEREAGEPDEQDERA